jgi:hypothetical protein
MMPGTGTEPITGTYTMAGDTNTFEGSRTGADSTINVKGSLDTVKKSVSLHVEATYRKVSVPDSNMIFDIIMRTDIVQAVTKNTE